MPTTLLPFSGPCTQALFLRRYKRFFVDAMDPETGEVYTAHTNNTGSMLGLLRPGAPVLLSPANNPARKLRWTLECVDFHGTLVGVNTATPNRLLKAAWKAGALPEVVGYPRFKAEAVVGDSRLDAHLSGPAGELWVECKNVTLVEDDAACFPDAVTARGQKHLEELMSLAAQGARVALFFLIQRADGRCFGPADFIDQRYGELFWRAVDCGVEAWPYVADVTPEGIGLLDRLELVPRP